MVKNPLLIIIASLLLLPALALAKAELSISSTDITFSQNKLIAEQTTRAYARILNVGDSDASGQVEFTANGASIAPPQSISLKPNTYDDVFIDWKPEAGTYVIEVTIAGSAAAAKKELAVTEEKPAPVVPAENQAVSGPNEPAPSPYQAAYDQIQQGIEKFAALEPVQYVAQYADQLTGGLASAAVTAAIKKATGQETGTAISNYTKNPPGWWDKYKLWILGGLAALVLLWMLRKLLKFFIG